MVKSKKLNLLEKSFEGSYNKEYVVNKEGQLFDIPISLIIEDKDQPRKLFKSDGIDELAKSIKEQGLINPITVRPTDDNKYKIIAGERRFLASKKAGLKDIPAIVRDVEEADVRFLSLIENIQREDLNDIDKGKAVKELKEKYSFTWEEIASKLGLKKRRILQIVSLLNLPGEIKEDIRKKKISSRKGLEIKKIKDSKIAKEVHKKIVEDNLSLKDTEELVKGIKEEPETTGRFKIVKSTEDDFLKEIQNAINKVKFSINKISLIKFYNLESKDKKHVLKCLYDIDNNIEDIKNIIS